MKAFSNRGRYFVIVILLIFVIALIAIIGLYNKNTLQVSVEEIYPKVDGSFIQNWLVADWDDAKWLKEFQYLKEAGMHYLIFAPAALGENGKVTRTIYPSKIDGYQMWDGYHDLVDICLRNAQKVGIKVFLGLNMHEDWWKNYANDPIWLYERMEEGNAVADELYNIYRNKYQDTFYGWYWVWEIDNNNFKSPGQQEVLSYALNINLDYLSKLDKSMPVMFSPYMNKDCGTADEYCKMWINVFSKTRFRDGDIFCPQDGVGAGGLEVKDLDEWFSQLKKVVDTKEGLHFWANSEIFNQKDWTSAPVDRFLSQLNAIYPYVENQICFAYSHYYSPNNVDDGFHKTYMNYLKTGNLESDPPSAPSDLKLAVQSDGNALITWKESIDDTGVLGYLVYRNGNLLVNIKAGKDEKDGKWNPPAAHFLDTSYPLLSASQSHKYEVKAYDFANNISESKMLEINK